MPTISYTGPNAGWQPEPGVTDMNGKPLPAGLDFPVAPPPGIGRVVRATSDLRVGRWVPSFAVRIGIDAATVLAAAVAVPWAVHRLPPGGKPGLVDVALTIGPMAVAILALASLIRRRWVAYVGDAGAAVLSTRGGRTDVGGPWFRFADVGDVQIDATPRDNGWVEWKLHVVAPDGKPLLDLKGNAQRVGKTVLSNTVYAVAAAIHETWKQRTPPAV